MRSKRSSAHLAIVASAALAGWFVSAQTGAAWARGFPQESSVVKTVWDGVYTEAQAERGKEAYESYCSHCHDTGEGPPLAGEGFMRRWFDDGLDVPFEKMRTAMPASAPGSLSEATYLDVLAFILSKTGIPAGSVELSPDRGGLATIKVVGKEGVGGPVPNSSTVSVIGCLTRGVDGEWRLTRGTEPVRAKYSEETPRELLEKAVSTSLGSQTFRFVFDYPAPGTREPIEGHKILAIGTLLRQPDDNRLNLFRLQSLGVPCGF